MVSLAWISSGFFPSEHASGSGDSTPLPYSIFSSASRRGPRHTGNTHRSRRVRPEGFWRISQVRPLGSRVTDLTATLEAPQGSFDSIESEPGKKVGNRFSVSDVRTLDPRLTVRPNATLDVAFLEARASLLDGPSVVGREMRTPVRDTLAQLERLGDFVPFARIRTMRRCAIAGPMVIGAGNGRGGRGSEIRARVPQGVQRLQIVFTSAS